MASRACVCASLHLLAAARLTGARLACGPCLSAHAASHAAAQVASHAAAQVASHAAAQVTCHGAAQAATSWTQRISACQVVAVGASTGGPQALEELLRRNADQPLPAVVLVAQHMPALFTRGLVERLRQATGLPVREAADGEAVCAGDVLIAPGNAQLEVQRRGAAVHTRLSFEAYAAAASTPSIDRLFHSVAQAYGPRSLAMVLTGMGSDGLRGAHDVAVAGGLVLAQDQRSSTVWGMPRQVVEAGLAPALPLRDLRSVLAYVGRAAPVSLLAESRRFAGYGQRARSWLRANNRECAHGSQ